MAGFRAFTLLLLRVFLKLPFQINFLQSTPVYLLVINLLDGIWSKIRSSSFSGTTIHWRPQRAGEVNQNDFSLHTQHPIDFPPLPNRRPIGARLNHDRSAVVSSQIRNSASPLITITCLTYHLGGLFANPPPPVVVNRPTQPTCNAHCDLCICQLSRRWQPSMALSKMFEPFLRP